MGLTKLVLRRPVSTVLAILCLIVFGLSSVMKSPLELMPDMNMSMMIVMTVYSGASLTMSASWSPNRSRTGPVP